MRNIESDYGVCVVWVDAGPGVVNKIAVVQAGVGKVLDCNCYLFAGRAVIGNSAL